IGAMLANNAASLQFARLVATGAFRNAEAAVDDSTISFTEKRTIKEWPREASSHMPGMISLCRNEDEVSLVIVTRPSPAHDSRCTVMGRIGPGTEVIRAMIGSRTGKLLRTEVLSGPDLKDLKLAPAGKVAAK